MLFQALLSLVLVYLGWHLLRDPDAPPAETFLDGRGEWAALPERRLGEAAALALPRRAAVQADLSAVAIRYSEPEDGPAVEGVFAAKGPGRLPRPVVIPR
jgi:hypothetical protein